MIPLLTIALSFAPDHRPLLDAIRAVESGGDNYAIGDGGRSRGPYQIGKPYWQDGCEFGKVNWPYELVYSRRHSEQVMLWYWQRYGARTDEQRARMHNGGARGHRKQVTLPYWRRVQRELAPAGLAALEAAEK